MPSGRRFHGAHAVVVQLDVAGKENAHAPPSEGQHLHHVPKQEDASLDHFWGSLAGAQEGRAGQPDIVS